MRAHRSHRNYVTTHRKMRRLVRVFTATEMLDRINKTKRP